jgi:hypothetical protein
MHTKFGIHSNSQCQCSCEEICQSINEESFKCVGALTTYPTLTSLWELVVCPCDEYSKWHDKDYLLGTRENCGVNNLPICLIEEEGCFNILVSWKHYST